MRRWTASTLRRSRPRSLAGMSTSAAAIAHPLLDTTPCSTSTDSNLSASLALARRLLLSGDLSAARRHFAGVAASSPLPDSLAAVALADSLGLGRDAVLAASLRCLLDAGLPHRAEELFLAFFPEVNSSPTPELMNCMVVCCTRLGKLSLAFDWLVRMIKMGSLSDNTGYVALLLQLCYDGKLGDATNLFFQMYKLRMLPCSSSCTTLINRLCWVGKLNEAFYVFNLALNSEVKPTVPMYRSLLPALCRSGLVEDAESLLCDTMDVYDLVPDIEMFSVIMRAYCKVGKMCRAEGLLKKIKENGWKPDTRVYNFLIEGLLSVNNEDGGWKYFRLMVEDGVERNWYSYYLLLNYCCKGMRLERAFEVWNEMVCHGISPNIRCYQSIVCALYKEEVILGANRFLQEMLERGLLPDHFMFTQVIKTCPIEGKAIVALMIFKAFSSNDNDVVTSFIRKLCSPDETEVCEREIDIVYNQVVESKIVSRELVFEVLVNALCVGGKTNLAFSFLSKMVGHDLKPLTPAYNSLIKYFCMDDKLLDAEALIGLMWDRGVTASTATYLIIIDAHCKRGNIPSALNMLDEMVERGVTRSVAIFDTIVSSLFDLKRYEEAEFMCNRMFKDGNIPDMAFYTTMINGYAKLGNLFACRLLDVMIEEGFQLSIRTYCALLNGLLKKNILKLGVHYLERMINDEFSPNAFLYTMIIHQFAKKGDISFALSIFNLMMKNQIKPDLHTYGSLITGICRNVLRRYPSKSPRNTKLLEKYKLKFFQLLPQRTAKTVGILVATSCGSCHEKIDLAWKLFDMVEESGLKPDLHIYNGLLNGYCRANMMGNAYKILNMIQDRGIWPNQITYTILINGHTRLHQIDESVELFNHMNAQGCIPDMGVYNSLIKGYCKVGRVLEALYLSISMQKRGLNPNKTSYDKLVLCLFTCHFYDLGKKLREEMVWNGFTPSHYYCSQIQRNFAANGQLICHP